MSGITAFQAEALRLYGLQQDAIDKINTAEPSVERMIGLVSQAQPMMDEALALFAKAKPIIDEATALYAKAQPLIAQANEELKTIMPAALAVRAFQQNKPAAARTPQAPDRFGAGSA